MTIYRSDYNLPMASIKDAPYNECAVFTGDYDVNDPDYPGYYDYLNGWERQNSAIADVNTHFGEPADPAELTGQSGFN